MKALIALAALVLTACQAAPISVPNPQALCKQNGGIWSGANQSCLYKP